MYIEGMWKRQVKMEGFLSKFTGQYEVSVVVLRWNIAHTNQGEADEVVEGRVPNNTSSKGKRQGRTVGGRAKGKSDKVTLKLLLQRIECSLCNSRKNEIPTLTPYAYNVIG